MTLTDGTAAADLKQQDTDLAMRIGYFGGTFDPPHRAHLHVARAAAETFALDRVLLVPTGLQPLKDGQPGASYEDRMTMTRLLCADDTDLEASHIDAPHPDGTPNYTVDALDRLRTTLPDAEIFVIVGADSFSTLPHWHQHERLLAENKWIVVSRPDFEIDDVPLTPEQRINVHPLTSVHDDISSSGIRERLHFGVSCNHLLTATVNLYIARMHLYHAT